MNDQTWDIKEGEVSVDEADEAVAERERATRAALLAAAMQVRTNRRKPAAPQYIRPEYSPDNLQPDKTEAEEDPDQTINGVCVMNQSSLTKNGESVGEGSPEAEAEGMES